MTTTTEVTEATFEAACRSHDLTGCMSDDHRVWQQWRDSSAELKRMAEAIGIERGIEIFNRVVDTKIVERSRSMFYWGRRA